MKYFREIEEKDKIECLLCYKKCSMSEGQSGFCGVNKNEDGELKNIVYGYPVALNIDPIEKKPLYHFYPGSQTLSLGSVGCNARCPFCQNWQISQSTNLKDALFFSPEEVVEIALKNGIETISYTYNEPTIFYQYAKDIGVLAKKHGIKSVFVTNGLESAEVIADMASWIESMNIDLKSFSDEYYKKEIKGDLGVVKESIKKAKELGIWVEVTTLLMEDINSSEREVRDIAQFLTSVDKNMPWHISAFFPTYLMSNHKPTQESLLRKAYDIGKDVGLSYIYLGNVAVNGVTKCINCDDELIVRDGFEVIENRLLEGGICPNCNKKLHGYFL